MTDIKKVKKVLELLESQVDRKPNRRGLNESILNELYQWFVQSWNDTSHFIDAHGTSEMTKGDYFKTTVAFALGFPTVAGLTWAHVAGKLKKVPGKIKQILNIAKMVLKTETKEEADRKLSEMGVKNLSEAKRRSLKKKG